MCNFRRILFSVFALAAAFASQAQSLREFRLHCTSSGDALKAFCARLALEFDRVAGIRLSQDGKRAGMPELRIDAVAIDKHNARVVFSVVSFEAAKRQSTEPQELVVSVTDANLNGANAVLPLVHPIVTLLNRGG